MDITARYKHQSSLLERLKSNLRRYESCLEETAEAITCVDQSLSELFDLSEPEHRNIQICIEDQETLWHAFARHVHKVRRLCNQYEKKCEQIKQLQTTVFQESLIQERRQRSKTSLDEYSSRQSFEQFSEMMRGVQDFVQSREELALELMSQLSSAHKMFATESTEVQTQMLEATQIASENMARKNSDDSDDKRSCSYCSRILPQ